MVVNTANDTIDVSIEEDGSERVLVEEKKYQKFVESIFSNDSADSETRYTGTIINEPTYGYKLERLMFSVGNRLLTEDYIKMRIRNAINMSPNSELLVKSLNDIVVTKDNATGSISINILFGGYNLKLI